jgi:hypothetical protein
MHGAQGFVSLVMLQLTLLSALNVQLHVRKICASKQISIKLGKILRLRFNCGVFFDLKKSSILIVSQPLI